MHNFLLREGRSKDNVHFHLVCYLVIASPTFQEPYWDKMGIPPWLKRGGCALCWGSTLCAYLCCSYLSRHCYPSKQGMVSLSGLRTEITLSWGPCMFCRHVKGHEEDAFTARLGTGSTLERKEGLSRNGVEHGSCSHPR